MPSSVPRVGLKTSVSRSARVPQKLFVTPERLRARGALEELLAARERLFKFQSTYKRALEELREARRELAAMPKNDPRYPVATARVFARGERLHEMNVTLDDHRIAVEEARNTRRKSVPSLRKSARVRLIRMELKKRFKKPLRKIAVLERAWGARFLRWSKKLHGKI